MKKLRIPAVSSTKAYRVTGYVRIPHKTAVVMLRMTPQEKAAWETAARQWSGSLSDWLRQAAAEYLELCASRAELHALATTRPPRKKRTGRRVA